MRHAYTVTLTVAGPLLSQASGARPFDLDAVFERDAQGRPVLPGTLVRGNLRYAWEKLAEQCGSPPASNEEEIFRWLGCKSSKGDEPDRGRLFFSHTWTLLDDTPTARRNRVRLDDKTGAVAPGALQFIQSAGSAGSRLVFTGCIEAEVEAAEAERLRAWIQRGLEFVPALGAFKGVGFGRLLHVAIHHRPLTAPAEIPKVNPVGFGLVLHFDRPFCFARVRAAKAGNNRFESEDFVPGAALKGALARMLARAKGKVSDNPDYPALARNFDPVRITHAFPAQPGNPPRRPVPLPMSLIAVDGHPHDAALHPEPLLFHGQAPAFQADWKGADWAKAMAVWGWPAPPRRLFLHNQIDRKTDRPQEKHLFSIEAVVSDHHVWLADCDLTRVPEEDRAQVADELANILANGVTGLGKTDARARVDILPERHAPPPCREDGNGIFLVILLTPARLLPSPWVLPPSNGGGALLERYKATWLRLSDSILNLEYFFACETLAGGGYLHHRFRPDEPYNPELLTAAGSVFAFTSKQPDKARKLLARWQNEGLPQHPDAPGGAEWRRTPFIAQNGYGEIVVNLEAHWQLKPEGGTPA